MDPLLYKKNNLQTVNIFIVGAIKNEEIFSLIGI